MPLRLASTAIVGIVRAVQTAQLYWWLMTQSFVADISVVVVGLLAIATLSLILSLGRENGAGVVILSG